MIRAFQLAIACLVITASSVSGALVTSDVSFGPTKIVDFSEFKDGVTSSDGPIQIGGLVSENIEWSRKSGQEPRLGSLVSGGVKQDYGLEANGIWNFDRLGFAAINIDDTNVWMKFDFNDGPVSAVGGLVNYAYTDTSPGFGDFIMEALNSSGDVIESYNISNLAPISTPGQTNAGEFRGIQRASADISALQLKGAYGVLDDLTFSRQLVVTPEPTSLAIFSIGTCFLGLTALRRRRKEKQAASF
ncbi:MAG: hypothetical protein COA78_37120 [Blastopirellula sp.]|nr:MAG: hypothetical protein COA78_37120 [Blastopirellula sp.]